MSNHTPAQPANTNEETNKHEKRPVRGIALILLAVFLMAALNAFVKDAAETHNAIELIFYRGVIALALLGGFIAARRQWTVWHTERPLAHFGRGLIGNIGAGLIFWSYAILPLADVTAVLFAAPLFVTILSIPILGEKVGPFRWAAVAAGFIGVLLIVRPFAAGIPDTMMLLPLAAALFNALVAIYLRELGKTEDPYTTVFYFLLFGILLSGLFMPFIGRWPTAESIWPILGAGIVGGFSLMVKTTAYKYAEASALSPFTYTAIVWATLFGWLFWGELPTLWVMAGAGIIIASNLLIIAREKQQHRKLVSATRAPVNQ